MYQRGWFYCKFFGETTIIMTSKAPILIYAFKNLQKDGYYMHRKQFTIKHRNNFSEQDHRYIKRCFVKSVGFQNLRYTSRTLKGIEIVNALYKQKRSLQQQNFVFPTYHELQ